MTASEDDKSEFSEELGVAYDRIEYTQEVYDRVCGRLSVKHPPLAKKQKVEDWLSGQLSDSQSSQATLRSESSAPSRARKRKSKQSKDSSYVPFIEDSKKSAPSKKKTDKITRKTLKLRRIKKKVKVEYETDEYSSGTTETEKDEDYSESDSSTEDRKKIGSSVSTSQRDRCEKAKKEEKMRTKTEKSMGELKRSVHYDIKEEKIRPRTEKPKEEKKRSAHNEAREEKTSTGNVKEVHVARAEKERRDEKGSEIKDRSLAGMKSRDSSKEVPPPPLKSILKKVPSSSDDSVLPSCMQHLFNGASSSPSISSLHSFKVPKKKDTKDNQVTKKTGEPSVLKEGSKEREEGGIKWDPRDEAFVPPRRDFRKPLLKTPIGVERRKSFDFQRQPETKPTPLMMARPSSSYEKNIPFEDNESWKESWKKIMSMEVPMDPMTSLDPSSSTPPDTFHSLTHSDKIDPFAVSLTPNRPLSPTITSITSYFPSTPIIIGTRSPHNQSIESDNKWFPTPKWTEGRETDYSTMEKRGGGGRSDGGEKRSSSDWMPFLESTESTRRRTSRWDRQSSPSGRRNEDNYHSPMNVITPISPPQSASHHPSINTSTPTVIPSESTTARYKCIPIDDECLPPWSRSGRYGSTSAIYSASSLVLEYEAMIVAGPVPDHVSKTKLEKMMKDKGADVEWTEAPPTKDPIAILERRIAVILCHSERTAKGLIAEGTLKVGKSLVPLGRPGEVLFNIEGIEEKCNENDLIEEITDTVETHTGGLLVELLLFPMQNLVVKGKARFFYAVHGSRAANGAPINMGGGRSISFSLCPLDQSTIWFAEIHSPTPTDVRSIARLSCNAHSPTVVPSLPSFPSFPSLPSLPSFPSLHSLPSLPSPSIPQPVPPPSIVSLSTSLGSIKKETCTTVSTLSNVSLPSLMSLTCSIPQDDKSKKEGVSSSPSPSIPSLVSSSKFSSFPPPTGIPPPGLIDPSMLKLVMKSGDESRLFNQTISIPPISVPASLIPLPPIPIPPPIHMTPILPFPDLPPIDYLFFQPPPPEIRRRSKEKRELMKIDPATFIKPFEALLPKGKQGEKGIKGMKEDKEEDEILLFARPMAIEPQPTDWDAVREYFKDDDCSSRIYGGVVSLRLTGRKAREKAQVLLLDGPHSVNGHVFSIGPTYSVLLEATRAVGKTRLYEEVMGKFGSVVEVEKKGDTPSGKPVYKLYFDKLEKAQSAASEGITVGESILSNIGRIPQ